MLFTDNVMYYDLVSLFSLDLRYVLHPSFIDMSKGKVKLDFKSQNEIISKKALKPKALL